MNWGGVVRGRGGQGSNTVEKLVHFEGHRVHGMAKASKDILKMVGGAFVLVGIGHENNSTP